MTHFLDEQTLQRWIDGELGEAEQHQLLRQLEQNRDGWRAVALAFMEHQLWTQASHDYVREPPPPVAASQPPEVPPQRRRNWLHHTALAASTLMAVGMGYLVGTNRDWPSGSSPGLGVIPEQSAPHPAFPRPRPFRTLPVVPLDPNTQPFVLPVYEAEELAKHGTLAPPQLTAEQIQDLQDQGVQVRQESHLYRDPNNRNLVTPFNTIQFRQPLQ